MGIDENGGVVDAKALRPGPWSLMLAVAGIGTLARIPQLGHSLAGDHAFRQTQTAFGVRMFAEHGIDLLHSPLPVFGSARDVPMEFPLFQAFARCLMTVGIDSSTAGRAAGLIAFQASCVLWWILLRRWRGAGWATTTLVMMEVLPYGLHWGASSLIDFFSVALGLAMVLGLDLWLRESTRLRWLGAVCGAVAAWLLFLVKVTSVPAMGTLAVLSVALAVRDLGWRAVWARALSLAVVGPAVGLTGLLLWTRHADRIKESHAATEFLTSQALASWNFGGSRLDPHSWRAVLGWAGGTAGALGAAVALGVLLGLALGDPRTRVLTLGLAAAVLAPILVFFNLFVIHSYYQITLYPLLVALGALGAVLLWESVRERPAVLTLVPVTFVVAWLTLAAVSTQGRHDLDQFAHESPIAAQVFEVEAATPPHARLVTVGCDWDPQLMYLTDRTGLMLRLGSRKQVDAIWRENNIRAYRYVVTCDSSVPMSHYLPMGVELAPTTQPDVFRLRRAHSSELTPTRSPGH